MSEELYAALECTIEGSSDPSVAANTENGSGPSLPTALEIAVLALGLTARCLAVGARRRRSNLRIS